MYRIRQKGPSPYYNHFLPYILIPIKNNESKVVKNFKRTIFEIITILDSIIIIHKFVFLDDKKIIGKKDRKMSRCDKILVHFKKFAPS